MSAYRRSDFYLEPEKEVSFVVRFSPDFKKRKKKSKMSISTFRFSGRGKRSLG